MTKKRIRIGLAMMLTLAMLATLTLPALAASYSLPSRYERESEGVIYDRDGREITLLPGRLYALGSTREWSSYNKYDEAIITGAKEYEVSVNLSYALGRSGKSAGDRVDLDVQVIYDGYMHRHESGVIYVEITDNTTGWRYLSRIYLTHEQASTMPICMEAGVSKYALSKAPELMSDGSCYLKFSFYTGNDPKQAPTSHTSRGPFMTGRGQVNLEYLTWPTAVALDKGFRL